MELLIHIIIILLVLGMLVWCVQQIPGLPDPIKQAVVILAVLAAAVYILNNAGIVALH